VVAAFEADFGTFRAIAERYGAIVADRGA
jgi:hypothetical protein